MSDSGLFLQRVIAARRASWFVFLIVAVFQISTYLVFLGMADGGLDGLIETGIYGDFSRAELTRLVLYYTAALKLLSTAFLMAALFLTLWVRGLRRIG